MAEKILVTGGAGYIGSILVPDLLELGYEVIVLDNFLYKENSLASSCIRDELTIVNGDVRDTGLVKKLLKSSDIIIPLAALVGAPICKKDPIGAQTINHDSVMMLFDNLSQDQKILMPTTNSAYGSGESGNFCNEDSPLNPISKYAIDKVEIEKKLMTNANAISFRLATVFGMSPRMRLDLLVNDFTYRAFKDRFIVLFESSFKRNYIHVRDVSRVFQHALLNFESMRGNIFNVGLSEANVSKKELCDEIKKQIPDFVYIDSPIGKDPDQRNYIVSNEKIEATGFNPSFTLGYGINELIKGFNMINNSKFSNI